MKLLLNYVILLFTVTIARELQTQSHFTPDNYVYQTRIQRS
jgi:hypothetical protein